MPLFSPNIRQACTFAMVALFSNAVTADILLNGTRVIYLSDAKDVNLRVQNVGSSSVLLQNWIDDGDADAKPAASKAPFFLSPPMNQLEPGKSQMLRINYIGNNLPMNKESLFWLNVLEVPSKGQVEANAKRPQIAFRNRIKLFYRPAGLPGDANNAVKAFIWSAQGSSMQANNPTPYYVSFVNMSVNGKKLEGTLMAPYSTQVLDLPAKAGNKVSGSFVNDYGAINSFDAVVK